jgi:hypothetical protein
MDDTFCLFRERDCTVLEASVDPYESLALIAVRLLFVLWFEFGFHKSQMAVLFCG